jgi:hypothetical protein
MGHVTTYEAIIAVANGASLIIEAPQEAVDTFDGPYPDDNSFEGVPDASGLYLCTVEFHFEQGYADGYKADGESDWKHVVTKSFPLISIMPDVSHSWVPKGAPCE